MQKSSYNHEEILKCCQGLIFGTDCARLPSDNLLMIDRVTHISNEGGKYGKGELVAELDINPDLWFFKCHFIDDPVMPGCLGLDAMWQLCGFFLAWNGYKGKGRALGVGEVKFTGQVLPDNKLVQYRINIRRIISRDLVLALADAEMRVDGTGIYFAKSLRVGMFTTMDAMA